MNVYKRYRIVTHENNTSSPIERIPEVEIRYTRDKTVLQCPAKES